jgi:membrane-associated protease RseP (regulator of RpoE activity)
MKKQSSRRLLMVGVALLAAVMLVVVSAAASVLAYRQFVEDDGARLNLKIEGLQVEQEQVEQEQETDGQGVVVLRVDPGSPAEQAGLVSGAVILSVNGRQVNSPEELKQAIGEYEAGDTVTLTIEDGDGSKDLSVTLADAGPYLGVSVGPDGVYRFRAEGFGEMPEGFVMPRLPGHRGLPGVPGSPRGMPFGFHHDDFDFDHFDFEDFDFEDFDFEDFDFEDFDFEDFDGEHGHFLDQFGNSAFVMSVQEDSPAAEAGLEAGDAIVEVNGQAVEDKDELIEALAELSPGDDISLQVQRGEESLAIEATLAPHPDDAERAYLGVFLAPVVIHREMELFEEQSNS